ncbi:DUF3616 domain-containing protein [Pontibacter silvestris]|uniref:DUF3616 domain-containing protein n=1 Tax=Pontibacter silvestris TaxID=2305183 RepID=A0ABW4WUG0_9BACT|nr:DUF3616 domain-containing protein [Pontibacter silvestris]MCC9136362.1 DUF3616 domain-containing protein [Pontibacter silvestris]
MEKKLLLHFDPALSLNPEGKHVRDGLSTVLRTGDNLWVCCDERITIERLTLNGSGECAAHQSFKLTDFIELPNESEVDIEGIGIAENYLWIIGSHSLKRKKPRRQDSITEQIKRLAKVKTDANRYLLARIPILLEEKTGEHMLYKEHPDPDNPEYTLQAAQLEVGENTNQIVQMLQQDKHLKSFMKIPGKDNGFDIEGLAVSERRIFIGLRGPVLRGWAIVLEVEVEEKERGILQLKPFANGQLYRKHFLQLRGKGIREMRFLGNDIYLLAGPTMDLDGIIVVYRWRNVLTITEEQLVHNDELERLCEVPHGYGKDSGKDKAEGLAIFDETHVLVVFDSPIDARKVGENSVTADLYNVIR